MEEDLEDETKYMKIMIGDKPVYIDLEELDKQFKNHFLYGKSSYRINKDHGSNPIKS